ncbi:MULTISPECIES: sulfite exporter TauE/SafE family protein [Anaerolinea]|uniref:urease accessory protein UreH domain-containing protein n=1 Tax=Anaerolinea TaxID=233189 RepID=UPI0026081C7A|nr:sulfite exporter TauE/SafE family protein [Anaerolinea thermophila]
MESLWVAFVTGLTTGGLSCMAVQGGLLASSLAGQLEKDLSRQASQKKKTHPSAPSRHSAVVFPILAFLLAKLTAYTLLGALLGALGSLFELTPELRAILLFGVGVFMLGNALRMLNVHPMFRYFTFEPPQAVRRWLRRTSREENRWFTPLMLGALTVLIPCGVTQTMMALAVGTGSAAQGAALLFAFTLGTSPVFFGLAYLATSLGTRLEKHFNRVAAVLLIILALVSVNSGLNLVGSPLSAEALSRNALQALNPPAPGQIADASNTLTLQVRDDGYFPAELTARAGEPVTLKLVTDNTFSCSRAFLIPALKVQRLLPATGTEVVEIPPQKPGTTLHFTCSMGMFTGVITFN